MTLKEALTDGLLEFGKANATEEQVSEALDWVRFRHEEMPCYIAISHPPATSLRIVQLGPYVMSASEFVTLVARIRELAADG
jgi:hypothetical protein